MRHLTTIFFACFITGASAQLPDYYVYLITGNATLSRTTGRPVTVKQHQLIYKTDILTLKKGAELTLVDKNSSYLVLDKPGAYNAGELEKKGNKTANMGMTRKYLELLFEELLDPDQDFEKFKGKNIAGVWGGVSRGDGFNNRIFPVDGMITSSPSLVFRWHKTSPGSNYNLAIYDTGAAPIFNKDLQDTSGTISLKDAVNGKPGKYYWLVSSKDGDREDDRPILLQIVTPEEEKAMVKQLSSSSDHGDLDKELGWISKLEANGFIESAKSNFSDLVKSKPGDRALRKSYVLFLLKYGFEDEAKSAWN